MKKAVSLALALCLVFALCACGMVAPQESDVPAQPSAAPETQTPQPEAGGPFTVETDLYEEVFTAEDGTELLGASYSMPILSGGAPGAAEKINAALAEAKEYFMTSEEEYDMTIPALLATANEAIKYNGTLGSERYALEHNYSVSRNDGTVITFVSSDYAYSGGAHGYTGISGSNFDALTGEEIGFNDLSGGANAFGEFCVQRLLELAAANENSEYFFEGWEETVAANTRDGLWYFSAEGLTFIFNAYDLGAYAMGELEFTIPYGELSGVMDAKWLPAA